MLQLHNLGQIGMMQRLQLFIDRVWFLKFLAHIAGASIWVNNQCDNTFRGTVQLLDFLSIVFSPRRAIVTYFVTFWSIFFLQVSLTLR